MKKAIKNPCTHRIQGRNVRVTTLFRICLAAHASSGFAPIGDTKTDPSRANERVASDCTLPPCRHAGRRLYGLKSPGDVTVAPVVPTAGSTHRSQNELHGNIPMPRTGRHLSEGFLSATLSAQTHFTLCELQREKGFPRRPYPRHGYYTSFRRGLQIQHLHTIIR